MYVYYHSWFQTPEIDTYWGIRWKMNTRNPEIINDEGQRQIASHYYPIIGPYSSKDTLVLQLQSLWMKYAGIDGVALEWFGTSNHSDFQIIDEATELAATTFDQAGLTSHLAYSDNSISNAQDITSATDSLNFLENDLSHLKSRSANHFWTRENNKPLLIIQGPNFIKSPRSWDSTFTNISWNPKTYVYQQHHDIVLGSGEFGWPWGGSGNHFQVASDFYNTRSSIAKMGGVYPGFRDYYTQGGWGTGVNWNIGMGNNGATFQDMLDLVKSHDVGSIQIATWNNYNEGTMIEPTAEMGTVFLETLQTFTGVPYTKTDLDRCLRWYSESVEAESNHHINICRQIYFELISLNTQRADELFEILEE